MSRPSAPRTARRAAPAIVFPTDVVLDSTIDIFFASIDAFHTNPSMCGVCSRMADTIRLYGQLDRACARVLQQSVKLKYYLFFLYSLLERPHVERRFLDGTFGVTLFTGSYGEGPRDVDRFRSLSPLDVLKDRLKTAAKLATFDGIQIQTRSAHYFPSDLPEGVGKRVAAFVGRCRLLVQCVAGSANSASSASGGGVGGVGSTACVTTCDGCRCGRAMLNLGIGRVKPTMQELFGADASSSDDDDDDDGASYLASWDCPTSSYWTRLCPGVLANLPRLQFCCSSCVLSYEQELAMIMPVNVASLESHECQSSVQGKVGLGRVVAVARAAVKRNAAAVRALRQARHAIRRSNTTLSKKTIESMHSNVEDMLAIDLGILTAAAAVAESPVTSNGRILPGTQPDWRSDLRKWTRAIEITKSHYLSNRGPEHRSKVIDERDVPTWLRKTIDSALDMFPIQLLEDGTAS